MSDFWMTVLTITAFSVALSAIGIVLWAKGKTKPRRFFGILLDVIGGCILFSFLLPSSERGWSDTQEGITFILIVAVLSADMLIPALISNSRKEKQKLARLRRTIVKTKFIDSSHTVTQRSHVRTGSAVGRAIVGDLVAGPVGAIVGSSTARETVTTNEKHTTTFMIYYRDGTRQHQTVENGTALYNLYMEKLDLD